MSNLQYCSKCKKPYLYEHGHDCTDSIKNYIFDNFIALNKSDLKDYKIKIIKLKK